jgi:hypothetical protein
MNSGRFPKTKALLDDLPAQDVEVAQNGELLGIGEEASPLDLSGEADFALALGWKRESRWQGGFFQTLVKARGEQKKLPVKKGKASTPLGDSAFAKDHALAPTAQSLAHHRPFLESHVHQGGFNHSLDMLKDQAPDFRLLTGKMAFIFMT